MRGCGGLRMRGKTLADGLAIFLRYAPDACGISVSHDEIHVGGVKPEGMTTEDRAWLDGCGWMWNEEFESWSHFT